MTVPASLRELLVCPRCKGELTDKPNELECQACRLGFPVRNGIPIMLVEEARVLEP